MAHLLKYVEWQSPTGYWHCNDTSDLIGPGSKWWTPARMLGISLTDFVNLLINDYKVDRISYSIEHNVLLYSWDKTNYGNMHKFVLWINRESRKRNYIC